MVKVRSLLFTRIRRLVMILTIRCRWNARDAFKARRSLGCNGSLPTFFSADPLGDTAAKTASISFRASSAGTCCIAKIRLSSYALSVCINRCLMIPSRSPLTLLRVEVRIRTAGLPASACKTAHTTCAGVASSGIYSPPIRSMAVSRICAYCSEPMLSMPSNDSACLCSIRDCGFSHVKVSGLVMGACRPLLQGLV